MVNDLVDKTNANPAGSTFWLAPGRHYLTPGDFTQVATKDGNTYLGAPGSVLDGRMVNRYAFTEESVNVTIRYLEVTGFDAPNNEGVVNHNSGNGWTIEHCNIHNNGGAAVMCGADMMLRFNRLVDNGQYAFNAYQSGDGITNLTVEGNEIGRNNTDDWETRIPGCGCTGGGKFWVVNGCDVRNNWVHGNFGPGLWADTNNNDFLIEGNLIEDNAAEAIFYEISYNAVIRNNTIVRNAFANGQRRALAGDNFPEGAVYLSESGGEPRVSARTDKIEIYGNQFIDNWGGVILWENADRFANSPSNTSSGYSTLLVSDINACSVPGIDSDPLYDDCRWRTQNVDIHDNEFHYNPSAIPSAADGYSGRMAVLANWGTFPDWSPYKAGVIQQSITFNQNNAWHNNKYVGPWKFCTEDSSHLTDWAGWTADPFNQDAGSTQED